MKRKLFSSAACVLGVLFITCSADKKAIKNEADTTALVSAKELPMAIENSNLEGTDWTMSAPNHLLYRFRSDHSCCIKGLLDTAAEEYRKAKWNLSNDTLYILEEDDTTGFKVMELTTEHFSLASISKSPKKEDDNDEPAADDYLYLSEGGEVRLARERVLFSGKQNTEPDSRLLIGYWDHKGYYSMADKSYEFDQDGTYTYIEGPRFEEKYISVKQGGKWSLQNNLLHLTRSTDHGEQLEELTISRITTSHLAFEGRKEVYLKFLNR